MESLLAEHAVAFAENQFTEAIQGLLAEKVVALGGKVVADREQASIMLVHPTHPQHAKEKEHMAYLAKTYPKVPQPAVFPYHWLANCIHEKRLLSLDELPFLAPIFTYPAQSENWRPLRVWVSINVTREEGESPEAARDSCVAKLEAGGGVGVAKRSLADLLVVDETSQFAKKVHHERNSFGRSWQRIVERDWVDGAWRNKKITWRRFDTDKDKEEDGEDSMVEDDTPYVKGRGVGRPTGTARVEYTPQDDDFLCRWLAAHHPSGSWHSRKTYSGLVDQKATYAQADRHSAQSWHERYKKNSAVFERRVKRFIQQGIDETLKTKEEREKARIRAAALAAEDESADQVRKDGQEAGPSRTQAPIHPVPSSSSAQPAITTQIAESKEKRSLVELEDESQSQNKAAAQIAVPQNGAAPQQDGRKEKAVVGPGPDQAGTAERRVDGAQRLTAAIDQPGPTTQQATTPTASKPQGENTAPTAEPAVATTDTVAAQVAATVIPGTATDTSKSQPSGSASTPSDILPSSTQARNTLRIERRLDVEAELDRHLSLVADKTTDADMVERELIEGELDSKGDDDESQTGAESRAEAHNQRIGQTPETQAVTERVELPETQSRTGSQTRTPTHTDTDTEMESESERGEGTQAILADFARIRAEAQARARAEKRQSEDRDDVQVPAWPAQTQAQMEAAVAAEPRGEQPTDEDVDVGQSPKSKKHVRMDDQVTIVPVPVTRGTSAAPPTAQSPKPSALPAAPEQQDEPVTSAATIATHQAATSSSTTAVQGVTPIPAQRVDVTEATTAHVLAATSSTAPAPTPKATEPSGSAQSQRNKHPHTPTPLREVSATHSPSTPYSSPLNSNSTKRKGRQSLLRDRLTASASKRRRTLGQRASMSSAHDESEVDTVYADVSLPARPVRLTPLPPSDPAGTSAGVSARAPSPPLNPAQRAESVSRGRSIALDQAREYKERISALSGRYGLTPSEVVRFVSELKARDKKVGLPGLKVKVKPGTDWDDVERGLKERFGGGGGGGTS